MQPNPTCLYRVSGTIFWFAADHAISKNHGLKAYRGCPGPMCVKRIGAKDSWSEQFEQG